MQALVGAGGLEGAPPVTPTATPPPGEPATTHTPTSTKTPRATATPRATRTPSPTAVADPIGPELRNGGFEATADDGSPASWQKHGGTLSSTNHQSDLAIQGDGFFIVKDPTTGASYATRAGNFAIDPSGFLVTGNGLRVQGFTAAGSATIGDIQIDGNSRPATASTASMAGYDIGSDGTITIKLTDGSNYVRGQILTQNFTSPQALIKQGNNLYSGLSLAGPVTPTPVAPTSVNGLGSIVSGSLEQSNVDLAGEFANLIAAQRGFDANAKIVTTSDEVLQTVINLKR